MKTFTCFSIIFLLVYDHMTNELNCWYGYVLIVIFHGWGVPSQDIAEEITDSSKGVVAVHCKAGLGITGSLIGAYLIKHYRMTAQEAIAWLRICRPGSVNEHQQTWLEDTERWLWRCGETYRIQHHGDGDKIPRHFYGIYSTEAKSTYLEREHQEKSLIQNILMNVTNTTDDEREDLIFIHEYF